ncbi:hypothetical protein DFR40_0772 [Azonexus fungiphilus]|uniref:Lipoprotein n=1 Tax=Azonexus fungiphilus TaxID=146940 RepID=A0A495WJ15_9RHOO|nr:hypothetical protein [Azonexus fungiphilus]RKT60633.1 hypothetical protein DFR40_0772 [Azonexus fungiphilus]
MKYLIVMVAVVVLAGCGSVRKVETGTNKVGERFSMQLEGPWNHVDFPGIKPGQLWTMEGITVDELIIYAGIKDGQVMHPDNAAQTKKQNVVFRRDMPTEKIVSMFESVMTRDDSVFKLLRIEPSSFAGRKGFLFEFERIRRNDNLRQLGFGYGAVDDGELFALVYVAPALTFFPRHQARVEAIAHSALISPPVGAAAPVAILPPPVRVSIGMPGQRLPAVSTAARAVAIPEPK